MHSVAFTSMGCSGSTAAYATRAWIYLKPIFIVLNVVFPFLHLNIDVEAPCIPKAYHDIGMAYGLLRLHNRLAE